MKYATRFDEQPSLGFEAAKWAVVLTILFTGGWLGETAGRSTGSHVIAGLLGAATALGIAGVLAFGEDPTSDEGASLLSRPLRIGFYVILSGLLGMFVIQTLVRLAHHPDYDDSTSIGFVLGLIPVAAIGYWRKYRALKRQQFQ